MEIMPRERGKWICIEKLVSPKTSWLEFCGGGKGFLFETNFTCKSYNRYL